MAKKKPPTVKLDATVKATHPGMRHKESMPERVKPIGAFRKAFAPGAMAILELRRFNQKTSTFYLETVECMLLRATTNCFYYEDEDGRKKSKPWWGVYDFNIEGQEEPDTANESGGGTELPDEQGSGVPGGDTGDGSAIRAGDEPADL